MQDSYSKSVLGITDFGPVAGTPLIPPSFLTAYFVLFLLLLALIYGYFYWKRRPVLLWHKLKLLAVIALIIKVVLVAGVTLLTLYWLLPTPSVIQTTPIQAEPSFSPTNRIEIIFDRPISRTDIEKSISPEVAGRWAFENSIYTTHLYRKLVFYPTFSLQPSTTYTVKLTNIRNLIKASSPFDYQFEFTTQSTPKVETITPSDKQSNVGIDSAINVTLDKPNEHISEFNFYLDPQVPFDLTLDATDKVYTLKPQAPLKQGTKYNLRVTKSNVILNLEDQSVSERTQTSEEYNSSFTTIEAPGIKSFKPNQNNALTDSEIVIEFSKPMDKKSVESNLSINPTTALGRFHWADDQTLSFKPNKLSFETEYSVKLAQGTRSLEGGRTEEALIQTFTTIGPVQISSFNPGNNLTAISLMSPVQVTFDQEVDHNSAESKFSLTPQVKGNFSWKGNTLIFAPSEPFLFSTNYTVKLAAGVKSLYGVNSKQDFQSKFTTLNSSVRLAVPAYLQKYTLSCEIASLRMALNFRGANVSEDDLIPQVGLDPTAHSGNIWGNPNSAFVGNIKGTQMADGYGVHWGPIAKAARNYRGAQDFQGWSITDLTRELSNGNPVIIWVYSHYGTPTSWKTPDGTDIYAVRDEHAVVAVGFVGPSDNPTQVIINDPLSGQVYWSRSSFDKKWNIFNRSGVVIY